MSGQPASKNVVVTARRFETRQFGFVVSANRPDATGCDYWALARCAGGWRMELAVRHERADVDAFARVLCGVDKCAGLECAAYSDEKRGDHRLTLFEDGRFVGAVYLSRQPVAVSRAWAVEQLVQPVDRKSRHRLIAGRPGIDQPDPGPTICVCHSVGANEIAECIASGSATLDDVGRTLGAGTNCGSCRAEISELIDEYRPVPAE